MGYWSFGQTGALASGWSKSRTLYTFVGAGIKSRDTYVCLATKINLRPWQAEYDVSSLSLRLGYFESRMYFLPSIVSGGRGHGKEDLCLASARPRPSCPCPPDAIEGRKPLWTLLLLSLKKYMQGERGSTVAMRSLGY